MLNTNSVQSTIQLTDNHPKQAVEGSDLLSMIVLSVYAARKTNRKFRKLRRQFLWTAFRLKLKSKLSRKAGISDRTLIYILLGALLLILIIYYPLAALLLAILFLILLLTGTIKI